MKTVCVYHSIDLDGWMSAAIVKHWFGNQEVKTKDLGNGVKELIDESIEFVGYNYGQPIPDLSGYDKVIMCDILFPKEEMFKLADLGRIKFIWIDHHISAIKDNKEILESEVVYPDGLRDTEYAACELTWKYFFPNKTMPEIVRLLGRYDCFGHKGTDEEQKVLEFQYGARQCISNYEDAYSVISMPKEHQETFVYNTLEKGESVYQYLCTEAKQTYKNGFKIILDEKISDSFTIHRKFICINKERFNPINFGIDYHKNIEEIYWCIERKNEYGLLCEDYSVNTDSMADNILKFKIKKEADTFLSSFEFRNLFKTEEHMWISKGYDGAACFHYANGKWNFSLYNDNGSVDCSVIAKQFGGGGHKGAAGFVVEDINTILK